MDVIAETFIGNVVAKFVQHSHVIVLEWSVCFIGALEHTHEFVRGFLNDGYTQYGMRDIASAFVDGLIEAVIGVRVGDVYHGSVCGTFANNPCTDRYTHGRDSIYYFCPELVSVN